MNGTVFKWEIQISTSSKRHKHSQIVSTFIQITSTALSQAFKLPLECTGKANEVLQHSDPSHKSFKLNFSRSNLFWLCITVQKTDATLLVYLAQVENRLPTTSYQDLAHDGLTSIFFSLQLKVNLVNMLGNYSIFIYKYKGGIKCQMS